MPQHSRKTRRERVYDFAISLSAAFSVNVALSRSREPSDHSENSILRFLTYFRTIHLPVGDNCKAFRIQNIVRNTGNKNDRVLYKKDSNVSDASRVCIWLALHAESRPINLTLSDN